MNEELLERARLGEYEGDYSLAVHDLHILAAEVARLRDEARWIPTAERLPNKHTLVLVQRLGTHIGFIGSRGWLVEGVWVSDMTEVTHWCELPSPPEVQP